MAVQPALLMWSRAGSSADSQDNFRRIDVMFTESYQILHDVGTKELDKYFAPGLPEVGAVYPGTNFVLAGRARMDQVSPIMTIATVEYRGEVAPGRNVNNPLTTPPTVDWRGQLAEQEIDEDIHGKRIQTKAGERIRGVKAEFPDIVLTVRRNFANWNSYTQAAYLRAVNSTPFAGWPAGTGRVAMLEAQSVAGNAYGGSGYWRGTLQVKFRIPYRTTPDKAWFARVFHQGFYCKKRLPGPPTSGGVVPFSIVPCGDGHKAQVATPQALDVDGFQVENNDEIKHNWLEFERYIPMNFYTLGFL
ncbi:MAG: hypothetical protein ACK5PB_14015 [Pirellula sp.]